MKRMGFLLFVAGLATGVFSVACEPPHNTHQIVSEQPPEATVKPRAVEVFVSGQVNVLRICDSDANRYVYVAWTPSASDGNRGVALQISEPGAYGCD
jgi:hypothetical protein